METTLKVLATSDLHGNLPEVPECDLLLVGGDVCPDYSAMDQFLWLDGPFRNWLDAIPAKSVVGIAGNHDFVFEKHLVGVQELHLPWSYLQDELAVIDGLTIYGMPWVPNLPRWAFYGGPDSRVSPTKIDCIPTGVDILLSHGPMHAYGDDVGQPFGSVGCKTMGEEIARIQPRAFVCGHIHEGYGHYRHRHVESGVYNVAFVDEHYEPVHDIVEILL